MDKQTKTVGSQEGPLNFEANSEFILKFAAALARAMIDYAFERAGLIKSTVREIEVKSANELLMNKAQFASRAGISERTLQKLMSEGLVEHTRPSPFRVFFTEAQLQKFIAGQATTKSGKKRQLDTRPVRVRAD
jgi:hypothetical protein